VLNNFLPLKMEGLLERGEPVREWVPLGIKRINPSRVCFLNKCSD